MLAEGLSASQGLAACWSGARRVLASGWPSASRGLVVCAGAGRVLAGGQLRASQGPAAYSQGLAGR